MTIKIQVEQIKRIVSCKAHTTRLQWNKKELKYDAHHSIGAEYESINFSIIEDENGEDTMQVANVQGNAVFHGLENVSLMINEPSLFGTFKPGDIVELRVIEQDIKKE
jgi:hypothetical protein